MNAQTILEQLLDLGITVTISGDKLRLEPGSQVPETLVHELRLHKPEVMARFQLAASVIRWAGDDPERWKRVHTALLRIYAPVWGRADARDVLVSWAAAWLAFSEAKRELGRFAALRRPLTSREHDARRAREADAGFWERLARWREPQVPLALAQDRQAATILETMLRHAE